MIRPVVRSRAYGVPIFSSILSKRMSTRLTKKEALLVTLYRSLRPEASKPSKTLLSGLALHLLPFRRCAPSRDMLITLSFRWSVRDDMRSMLRRYRDRRAIRYAELGDLRARSTQLQEELGVERERSARVAQLEDELRVERERSARVAQLEDELRLERERSATVAQLEEELRVERERSATVAHLEEELRMERQRSARVAQLEEGLRTEKERKAILVVKIRESERRHRKTAVYKSGLQTMLSTTSVALSEALAEQEMLVGEVTRLRETLSRQTVQEVETPAQLIARARQTEAYQTEATKCFAMGRAHGRNEILRSVMGAGYLTTSEALEVLKTPPFHPRLRSFHTLLPFSRGEYAASREYDRRGFGGATPWVAPMFAPNRTIEYQVTGRCTTPATSLEDLMAAEAELEQDEEWLLEMDYVIGVPLEGSSRYIQSGSRSRPPARDIRDLTRP